MMQPLALVVYEKLLPGSQLVNRLQDLNYRVQVIPDAEKLLEVAENTTPMVVLADLDSSRKNVAPAIARLHQHPATKHIPVVAFAEHEAPALFQEAQTAGATLVVTDTAILNHLPQLLEQALRLE